MIRRIFIKKGGDASEFSLFIAGETVVLLMLIAIMVTK